MHNGRRKSVFSLQNANHDCQSSSYATRPMTSFALIFPARIDRKGVEEGKDSLNRLSSDLAIREKFVLLV